MDMMESRALLWAGGGSSEARNVPPQEASDVAGDGAAAEWDAALFRRGGAGTCSVKPSLEPSLEPSGML